MESVIFSNSKKTVSPTPPPTLHLPHHTHHTQVGQNIHVRQNRCFIAGCNRRCSFSLFLCFRSGAHKVIQSFAEAEVVHQGRNQPWGAGSGSGARLAICSQKGIRGWAYSPYTICCGVGMWGPGPMRSAGFMYCCMVIWRRSSGRLCQAIVGHCCFAAAAAAAVGHYCFAAAAFDHWGEE